MRHRIQTIAVILLIVLVPFMRYIEIAGTKVNFSVADFLLPVMGILMLFNVKELLQKKHWLIIIYFAGLIFSLALSQFAGRFNPAFHHVSNSVMLMEMVKTIVIALYFLSAFVFIDDKNIKLTAITISLGSVPVILVGFGAYAFYFLNKKFLLQAYTLEDTRFRGTFEDPNLCALYFIVIIFISLYCLRLVKSKLLRVAITGVVLLSVCAVILTQSRGGWLALGGSIILFIALNIRNIRKESLLLPVTVILIFLLALNADSRLQNGKITNAIINRVQASLNQDMAALDRIQLMKAAFQMGNDNFLVGVGKGSFPLNTYLYLGEDSSAYKSQNIPHNTLLGFYAQQGIIGLLLFLALPGYLLFRLIFLRAGYRPYFIVLLIGILIHSMTINLENIRFVWFLAGILLAIEEKSFQSELLPVKTMRKGPYFAVLSGLLFSVFVLYAALSFSMTVDIKLSNGQFYEKTLSSLEPGQYSLCFDLQTDEHLHSVEVFVGENLDRKMNFRSAYGLVDEKLLIDENIRIRFNSSEEGWMKVNNAYLQNENTKIPLYQYRLLPPSMQDWASKRKLLFFSEVPSFRIYPELSSKPQEALSLLGVRVIRVSNLTHIFKLQYRCDETMTKNYQLDMLIDYDSIASLLPVENQRNSWQHRFTIYPLTSDWEKGKVYTVETNRLIPNESFHLYGRYYDYENDAFEQESYFTVPWQLDYKNQEILSPENNLWMNYLYGRENENLIHMTYNGWVESGRMNLDAGAHTLNFSAQGFWLDGYPEVVIRDSSLNEIAKLTLDNTMKDYSVGYFTEVPREGISFIFELINHKSEKDAGSRDILLKEAFMVD